MKLTWRRIAAAAIVSFGWASGATAAIIDLGSTSPLTLSGVPGLTTLVFSPSPDTDTKLANNVGTNDFANLFLPQNPTNVGSGVQALFGLGTAPTFISSPGNAGPGTFTATSPFNYAAVHQGTAEIVFFFATPQTSITFGPNTPQLSGINFYRGVAAVPEPATWAMMLLGFAGLGFAFRHSRRNVAAA
jgi:PEP-CTERM motif